MSIERAIAVELSCRTPRTIHHANTPDDVKLALSWLIGEHHRMTRVIEQQRAGLERIGDMHAATGYRVLDAREVARAALI